MVSGVTSLAIQPLMIHTDGKNRHTTITSFGDMMKEKVESEKAEASDIAEAEKDTETSDNGIIYTNPETGETYKYIDIAAKTASASERSSATTSAASMKTTKYDSYFKDAAKKYNVSESLLKAVARAESNFNANDVSSAGAIGVMQLMPSTAEGLGVSNPYDARQNIMGGAKYIAQKLKEFNGNVRLALAAYNAGSGAVRRAGGVPSYARSYVNKVLSYKEAYETAGAVG